MYVGVKSYYGKQDFSQSSQANEDLRIVGNSVEEFKEIGTMRGFEFYRECEKAGIHIEEYSHENNDKYNLILFWDMPNLFQLSLIKFKNIFTRIPVVLVLEDTPIARSRNPLLLPLLFDEVILNTEESNYKFRYYKTSSFSLPTLPTVEKIEENKKVILSSNRLPKINFIATNKLAININSSFRYREQLVRRLNLHCSQYFDLFGAGWERRQIPMDIPLKPLIARSRVLRRIILFLLNLFPYYTKSKGVVEEKSSTIRKYDFTLAIEPYIGKPKLILEKIFDPMLQGSIPIYYGPRLLYIPDNCYLRIQKNSSVKEIVNMISSLTEEDKDRYRNNIYNFLISKSADKYRYSTYAHFLVSRIKNFL